MSTIEVAGIPFTEEILTELKQWIVPTNTFDESNISLDIDSLLRLQSFLINHWDDISNLDELEMKNMLKEIDFLRRRFEVFNTIKYKNNDE